MEIVLATWNRGKCEEYRELLSIPSRRLRSLVEFPGLPKAAEEGATFAENARHKAAYYHRLLGLPVVADDSGLQVDLLAGEPGIHSARYSGAAADDRANIEKLLQELQKAVHNARWTADPGSKAESASYPMELSQFSGYLLLSPARFACALSFFANGREQFSTEGICEGFITTKPRGQCGFGYDPVFFVPSEGKTMAELPACVKNRISHRAAAARQLCEFLATKRSTFNVER